MMNDKIRHKERVNFVTHSKKAKSLKGDDAKSQV
jgi:hypothetical protein